jgi:hypothetical protein
MTPYPRSPSQLVNPLARQRMMGYGTAAGGSSSFDPLTLSGLLEWWSVEDLASVGDGNPVSSWAGRKAAITPTASTTARPTYVANAGDGLPALVPDGVDDSMSVTIASSVLSYFPGTSLEVWMVMYHAAASATNNVKPVETSAAQWVGEWLPFSDNSIYFDHPHPATARLSGAQPAGFDNAWHVVRFAKAGSARQIEVDGAQIASNSMAGDFAASASTTFRICGTGTKMKLRHLLLFNAAVTGDDLTALRTYLNQWAP